MIKLKLEIKKLHLFFIVTPCVLMTAFYFGFFVERQEEVLMHLQNIFSFSIIFWSSALFYDEYELDALDLYTCFSGFYFLQMIKKIVVFYAMYLVLMIPLLMINSYYGLGVISLAYSFLILTQSLFMHLLAVWGMVLFKKIVWSILLCMVYVVGFHHVIIRPSLFSIFAFLGRRLEERVCFQRGLMNVGLVVVEVLLLYFYINKRKK